MAHIDIEARRRLLLERDPELYAYMVDVEVAERLRTLHAALGQLGSAAQITQRIWATVEHHSNRAYRRLTA